MDPQASGQLRHFRIPEGEEHLALVAGYYIRLGIWHKRGITVDRESLADSNSYNIIVNKMGLIPQSDWDKRAKPKIRTASESSPHFYQFQCELVQKIILVGMWWRYEARDQRGYWDINPAQGGGCLLMDDRRAAFGGFPIHLSLLETPKKSWNGLINALNSKYPICRLGYVPYKAYYPAESSSQYMPAVVWPNLIDNIKLIQDICLGCKELEKIFSNNYSKQIDDWRWKSLELLFKRANYWLARLRYKHSWTSNGKSYAEIIASNPMHGKRTHAEWIDIICLEWSSDISLSENCIKINKIITKIENRPILLSEMTISRIIDRYSEIIRPKKPFVKRGSKIDIANLAKKVQELKEGGVGATYIAKMLTIPRRRVYRLLDYFKNNEKGGGKL